MNTAETRLELVATVGPASFGMEAELLKAGASALRLNASHLLPDALFGHVVRIRRAVPDARLVIDLKGSKIRLGRFAAFEVRAGETVTFALPESGSKRFIFSAKKQTGGRGRLGRKWQNGEGNLMFSAIVPCDNENSGILALVCGICVLETIKSFAPQAEIKLKWPNDVLLEDKKVC